MLPLFEAEADGLRELRSARAIRVPEVLACGVANGESFIELERFEFSRTSAAAEARLGEQLAELHGHTESRYGWSRDNSIGRTPQKNAWSENWVQFFVEQRLGFQLQLAVGNGYGGDIESLAVNLLEQVPELFATYVPVASLLHGDLWGGNWGSVGGEPVIFDPAVYYGDRETDIAMTMLFGGFGQPFYQAYQSSWPMAAGHAERIRLYQLYHVLNHLNLFGRSYLGQAIGLMRALL